VFFSSRQFTWEQEGPDNRVCKALITPTLKAQDTCVTTIHASGLGCREIIHVTCIEGVSEALDLNIKLEAKIARIAL